MTGWITESRLSLYQNKQNSHLWDLFAVLLKTTVYFQLVVHEREIESVSEHSVDQSWNPWLENFPVLLTAAVKHVHWATNSVKIESWLCSRRQPKSPVSSFYTL